LKVYVSTNGCEEAQLSSMHVDKFFRMNKLTITNDPTQADLVIFYACGLTAQTEKDSLIMIRKLQTKTKPKAKLLVWGCLPKINPQSLATLYEGPIIGPFDTAFFEKILEKPNVRFDDIAVNTLSLRETSGMYDRRYTDALGNVLLFLRKGVNKLRVLRERQVQQEPFYIRVATGCTGNCSYCSEFCVFGRIKSRPINRIVSEFERGLQKGHNRFFLAAEDLGAYGKDIGCTLLDLFEKMKLNDDRNYKIILNQINPLHLKEMFSDLSEEVFASGKIESLCSPVQSGSNRILKLMRRPYSAEEWREYMLRINKNFPNIRLKTHFMVGFPSETDEDFKATLRLLEYPLFIDWVVIFKFSARSQVFASRIPEQTSEKTKESRCNKLLRKYAYKYLLNVVSKCLLD
jgi:threonylcarbamoyladenosine tRNA methylthiotransferase CDKAL1